MTVRRYYSNQAIANRLLSMLVEIKSSLQNNDLCGLKHVISSLMAQSGLKPCQSEHPQESTVSRQSGDDWPGRSTQFRLGDAEAGLDHKCR